MAPENDSINIRPKLLAHVEDPIDSDLEQPLLSGFRPGALLLRIIQIGNTRSRTLADNLGEIELPASGIGSGDEQTAYRVDRSTEESAMTKGVTRYLGRC